MKARYLEVTFRKGKPFAAYLYLPRDSGAKSVRTSNEGNGIHVDYSAGDVPLGIEITSPSSITPEQVDDVLKRLGWSPLAPKELAPIQAA